MPVPVTKYTCEFKCGKKCVSKENVMKRHESVCWKNPENKTCKTCSNEIYGYEKDDDMRSESYYRGCKIPELSNVLEGAHPVMSFQNSLNVRPIYHCPYWNKEADEKVNEFAESLAEEIHGKEEGTKHYPFFNKPDRLPIEENGLPF